jgi:drug/metabolite transporter (DMT)-like permease
MSPRDFIQLLILASIWGSSFLFMRRAAPELGGVATAEIRVALAAIVLLVIALAKYQTLRLEYWRSYFFIGMLNCAVPFSLFAVAAQRLPAGYLSVLNATAPAFGALAAAVLLRETLGVRRAAGLALGLLGVCTLVAFGPVPLSEGTILGIGAGLFASACYGIAVVYLTRLIREVPGITVAACTLSAAAFQLLPLLVMSPTKPATLDALSAVAMLGVFCTAVAYLIYFDLVQRISPSRALVVTFLIPVFASLWGWLFLGEPVTVRMMLGALVCLLGTWLASARQGQGVRR